MKHSPKVKAERIRIQIYRPGEGDSFHEYEHCPIQFAADGHAEANSCPLQAGISCRFGLTAIAPPKECPLRHALDSAVQMKFTVCDE